MKIVVARVPPEGMKDRAAYDPVALDMDVVGVQLRQPFEADAFVVKADEELVVNVEIQAPLVLSCARCLQEFPKTLATGAVFTYKVQPTDIVDITDDVRQEVILAYPTVPVCRPECKGLCKDCGQNLNVAACSHQATGEPGR